MHCGHMSLLVIRLCVDPNSLASWREPPRSVAERWLLISGGMQQLLCDAASSVSGRGHLPFLLWSSVAPQHGRHVSAIHPVESCSDRFYRTWNVRRWSCAV